MGRSRGDQQGFLLGLVIPMALSHLLAALKPVLLLNQLRGGWLPIQPQCFPVFLSTFSSSLKQIFFLSFYTCASAMD